jgi:hypothetical protein
MQTVQVAHVPDVMLPSELQTCAPEPARARVHRWCVMARGGATACVAVLRRGTVRGRGLLGGSAKARGPRVTCLRRCNCQQRRRNSRRCSRWCNKRRRRRDRSSRRSLQSQTNRSRNLWTGNCPSRRCSLRCGQEGSGKVMQDGGKNGRGAQAHQPPLQLVASRRRACAPSTPSMTGDSCGSPVIASIVDSCGLPVIAIAISAASSLCGSFQPLAVESMTRRTSTRPIVLGEEDVPRNPRIASATGTAATVASRVPRSFGHAPSPLEGGAEALLAS